MSRLLALTCRLCGAPIAIVGTADGALAAHGVDIERGSALLRALLTEAPTPSTSKSPRTIARVRVGAWLATPISEEPDAPSLLLVDRAPRRWATAARAALRETARAVRDEITAMRAEASETLRAGAMLAQRDALIQDLLENTPMSVIVLDARGRVLLANSAAARSFGRPVAEVEGQPFSALIGPDAAAAVLAWDDEVRRSGKSRSSHEALLADGRQQHFQVSKFPVGERHGYDNAVASFVVDITESWTAQRRARALADLARAVAADVDATTALDAIAALALPEFADWCMLITGEPTSPERSIRVRHVDRAKEPRIEHLFREAPLPHDSAHGYGQVFRTGEPVLVANATQVLAHAAMTDPRRAAFSDVAACSYVLVPLRVRSSVIGAIGMSLSPQSGRAYGNDDVEFFLDVAARIGISLENHELRRERERVLAQLAGANADLERRVMARTVELEAQNVLLREARAAADRANETKSKFLAQMSHEIRTPMNAVLGMATLLLETQLTTDQRDSLGTLRSSAEALLELLNELLDVAKIEAGHVALDLKPIALRDVLREAVDLFASTAAEKKLELALVVSPEVPAAVYGDPTRLRQILVNLVGNAIKFTDRGGVRIEVRSPTAEEVGVPGPSQRSPRAEAGAPTLLRIAVRDTGIGMSKAHQAKLFQPFVQVYDPSDRFYGGTGLGLSIVRHMVELMGGRVEVASELGQGSELVVLLSLDLADSPSPAADTSPFDPTLGQRAPLRLLLAEDNVVNQRVALSMLARFGYEADLVVNGEDAVRAVLARSYDVVLMDVQMPKVDGVEAARQIRASRNGSTKPRIIAITASSYPQDRARCTLAGMEDFVTKPIRATELGAALRRAFAVRTGDG